MADKKLESFKIGDKQKPQVKTAGPAGKAKVVDETRPEAQTFGFARIETILDKEPPSEVSRSLGARREALKALEEAAKTPKDKAAAKKGMLAVDRTSDLLDYLFRTKAAMLESEQKAESKAGKSGKAQKGKPAAKARK